MINPDDIIAYARECLGTPFQHQGRVLGRAMDCAGVIVHVAQRLGFTPVQPAGYSRTPSNGALEDAAAAQPYLERIYTRQPGDVLMMRFTGEPQHVGIFAYDTLIHCYESVGRVVEHRLDHRWEARIVRMYRYKDVA